jgi:hypothetical protein
MQPALTRLLSETTKKAQWIDINRDDSYINKLMQTSIKN